MPSHSNAPTAPKATGIDILASIKAATSATVAADAAATETQLEKFHLYSVAELEALPPPQWLVQGIMERGVLAVLYGPSWEGKSFVAMDLGLHIVRGQTWNGRKVQQGPIVYVVGEGGKGGVPKRVRAWRMEHGVNAEDLANAFFVLEAVQLCSPKDVGLLLARIDQIHIAPYLIVLDTFARCLVGGDENSAKEVGIAIEACAQLQKATGATVLPVHHTGKANHDIERGSNALRGAADVMILQRMKHGTITLENTKQKDWEAFKAITLKLKQLVVGTDEDGKPVTSCVVVPAEQVPAPPASGPTLNTSLSLALKVLTVFPAMTASTAEWREAIGTELGQAVPPKTFQNWRGELEEIKLVEKVEGKTKGWYRVTPAGFDVLKQASASAIMCH